jgi:hypothetical protein
LRTPPARRQPCPSRSRRSATPTTRAGGTTKTALAGFVANSATGGDYASAWKPSTPLKLTTALPISISATGTMSVQLRITADTGGDWLADDIYIDPRMY